MTVDEHHFLLLVSEKALTWPEADAKAVALGVNWALASLDSRPEAEEVYQMLQIFCFFVRSFHSGDQAVGRGGM